MTLKSDIDQLAADAVLRHQVVHGDVNTTVTTAGGPVRSVAKLIADKDAEINVAASGILAQAVNQVSLATIQANNATSNGQAQVALAAVQASLATNNGSIQVALAAAQANNAQIDRVASEAARDASVASWTAALAANPDLNPVVRMNPSNIDTDLTIPSFYNAYSAGPLTIDEGVTATLNNNSNWSIL